MPLFEPPPSRRRRLLAATALGLALPSLAVRAQQRLVPTPAQTEGPFYPESFDGDADADLLQHGLRRYRQGEPTWVRGQVVDTTGRPLAGAVIEIWQCDEAGHYRHSRDRGPADPDFQGHGRMTLGPDGGYAFRTIRPVAYPGRTPHIHFKLKLGGEELLTTQLYVAGEAANARDGLWRRLSEAERAAVTQAFAPGAEGLEARFPIVVET